MAEYKKDAEELDNFIEYLRLNPVEAAYQLLGIKLAPHQRIMLKQAWNRKFVLWVLGRGLAKTFMLAVLASLRAVLFPGEHVVIVAASFRQSQLVFAEIEGLLKNSEFFSQCLEKRPSHSADGWNMVFKNESWVKALPLGADGSTIRGIRSTLILVDETAQVNETVIDSVILPFASTAKNPVAKYFGDKKNDMENSVVFASSAYYQFNHFYGRYLYWREMVLKGNEDYDVQVYNYLDAGEAYEVDMKMIDHFKDTFTKEQFDMEILAKFPRDSAGFYPASLLQSCVINGITPRLKRRDGYLYVLGVDPARESDRFALTVVELGSIEMQIANCQTYENISFPDMVNKIDELDNIYEFANINIDAGGGGLAIRDLIRVERFSRGMDGKLIKKPPYLVIGDKDTEGWNGKRNINLVAFGSPNLNEMNFLLKKNFEQSKMRFPKQATLKPNFFDEEAEKVMEEIKSLRDELESIQTEATQHGFLKFFAPGKMKKDRYSSLLLANYGAQRILDERLGEEYAKVSELPSGFWLPERYAN